MGVNWLSFFLVLVTVAGRPERRHLEVQNDSGDVIAVDWVHPVTGETITLAERTEAGERLAFDSFVNHTFVFRSLVKGNRNLTSVKVGQEKGNQVIIVREGLQVDREAERLADSQEAKSLVENCRLRASVMGERAEDITSLFLKCVEDSAASVLEQKSETLKFENGLLKSISGMAENYTCSDPDKATTEPREIREWTYEDKVRDVGIFHDRPASQIHIISDFISPEECEAVKEAAAATLHRGTVADGKGGSRLSEHRKAWQAGVKVDYSKGDDDPLVALKKRIFAYAEHAVGYGMELPGQEDIMSIQYFGNGEDDPTPDRYTPHCDGECNGRPAKKGARVATIVAYCDAPTLGGATNFQNANVFVKPMVGAAAFFSYMDPETRTHEEGFTSHSGCPVLQGTKRIAVQWMRIGVDDESPWDSFDTNTLPKNL